jgi:hypothetical protein
LALKGLLEMAAKIRVLSAVVVSSVALSVLAGAACSSFGEEPAPGADASTGDSSAPPPNDATVDPVRVDPKVAPIDKLTLILGSPTTVKVKVERGSVPDAFEIELVGLPKGVTAPKATIPFGQSSVDLTLTVSETADIGPVKVTVNATSPAGKASREVDLEVRGVPKTLDRTFGNEGIVTVPRGAQSQANVIVQPDGKYVQMELIGGTLKRQLLNGNPDASFGVGGKVGGGSDRRYIAMTTSPSGDLYSVVGGPNTSPSAVLVRKYDKDGQPLAFGSATDGASYPIPDASQLMFGDALVMPDGAVFVAVQASLTNGVKAVAITKLTATGAVDTRWGTDGSKVLNQVRQGFASSVKLFASGSNVRVFSVEGEGADGPATLRGVGLTSDVGALDATFGVGGVASFDGVPAQGPMAWAAGLHLPIARRADGKFDFGWVSGDTYANSLRMAPTGLLDPTFANNGRALLGATVDSTRPVEALVDSAGRTLYGFMDKSRKDTIEVRRYAPNGLFDASFELQLPPEGVYMGIRLESLRELPDGRLLISAMAAAPATVEYQVRYWP